MILKIIWELCFLENPFKIAEIPLEFFVKLAVYFVGY